MADYKFIPQSDVTILKKRLTEELVKLAQEIQTLKDLSTGYEFVLEVIDNIERAREQKERYGC